MRKNIIVFLSLYVYFFIALFLICFSGGIIVRVVYFTQYQEWPNLPFDFKGYSIKASIYGTACWLLSVIYKINNWDTRPKKRK